MRLEVQSFAVTANNVTYALAGDQFGYWDFLPGPGGRGGGMGRGAGLGAWPRRGVEPSRHSQAGERLYGYLPMAEGFDILPGDISTSSSRSTAPRIGSPCRRSTTGMRGSLPIPSTTRIRENERMVYGPLFRTGFLLERFFRTRDWLDAKALVLTSASSKTAFGLGQRGQTPFAGRRADRR